MEVAAREVRIILTIAIELGAATANTYGIDMGSSIYYVKISLDFFWSTHPLLTICQQKYSTERQQNWPFSRLNTSPFCWRNIWMVPIAQWKYLVHWTNKLKWLALGNWNLMCQLFHGKGFWGLGAGELSVLSKFSGKNNQPLHLGLIEEISFDFVTITVKKIVIKSHWWRTIRGSIMV